MARSSAGKSTGSSKIRFVMVEAEIAEGDLGQITQAIQNALRPAQPSMQRIPHVNGKAAPMEPEANDAEPEFEFQQPVEDANEPAAPPRVRSSRKAVKPPEVLNNLDLTSEPSLSDYMRKVNPKSHLKRYLAVAAWFKEARQLDAITEDHVYTCYRWLKWPIDIKDFGQPFRDLKRSQFFTAPERGQFAINQLGLQEVTKLQNEGE